MHAKDITPFKNDRRHGNWTKFWDDGRFNFMVSYIDGRVFGFGMQYHYCRKSNKLEEITREYYAR